MKTAEIKLTITQLSDKQYQLHMFSEDLNFGINSAYFELSDFTNPKKSFSQWVKDNILSNVIQMSEDLYTQYFHDKEEQ